MYTANQDSTKNLKISIIIIFRKERLYNHIKCSIKARGGRKREENKNQNNAQVHKQRTITNSIDINQTISIITININTPTKRQKLLAWIKKHNPTICYPQEIHFKYKEIDLKKGIEKDILCYCTNQKKLEQLY